MSNGLLAEFLSWACSQSGVPKRQAEALALMLIDGYTPAAIGAHLGLSAHQAAKLVRLASQRLAVQEYEPHEEEMWAQMLETLNSDETVRAHAVALLAAVRNSQDPTPRAVTYDDNGRPVARRDPLVSVEQAEAIVRRTPVRPARVLRENRLVAA